MAEWYRMDVDPAVREQEVLLMAARAQKEASRAYERGDVAGSRDCLARSHFLTASVPATASTIDELAAIAEMREALEQGQGSHLRKFAKFRSYLRRQGRSSPPPAPPETEKA
jgi:hypothetical protein